MDQIIYQLTIALPSLQAIYLFGSRVAGQERRDSDWDLAVLLHHSTQLAPLERWKIQEELAASLNADVDLVDLREATTVMRFEIISTGERIYCLDRDYCAEFEMYAYSFYQRLQEERKYILQDIQDRGSVYG